MINSKLLGGILLIIGTSIGGGMLALPISTAEIGFWNSIFFLVACWLVMTAGALLILEVNLRLPAGSNMVSMAQSTLGLPGQAIAWITYLLLLYTLLAAYISGSNDVFNHLLQQMHINLPSQITCIAFTGLLGLIVYKGIHSVDYVNRGLMFGKIAIYLILVLIISPHVTPASLSGGSARTCLGALMVLVTSFGFATIVPSLRDYFHGDVRLLRRAILIGSLIPLICYIVWDAVIMGVVSREGSSGLLALMGSDHATSALTHSLNHSVNNHWIKVCFNSFTAVCMLTAFLGVSIALFDFLADGLKLKKTGRQGYVTFLLTFMPPLVLVLFKPGIYLRAFSYAGICCVILLLLLPSLMAFKGRRTCTLPIKESHMVPGGNYGLSLIALISIGLLITEIIAFK